MGLRGAGSLRSIARTRAAAAVPAKQAAAAVPALAINGGVPGGGSFLSNLAAGIVAVTAFGFAISIGHRAADFFTGPRAIKVIQVPSEGRPPAAPAADVCGIHNKAFANCMNHNGSDISRCRTYLDMLNQCRRGSLAAATTIA